MTQRSESLLQAYRNNDVGRHDPRIDAKEAAVRTAFEYAIRWNACQHAYTACCLLTGALCAIIQVRTLLLRFTVLILS